MLSTVYNIHANAEEVAGASQTGENILDVRNEMCIADTVYMVNTSIVVRSGAVLELNNATLVFQNTTKLAEIVVEYNATIRIINSTMRGENCTYRFIVNGKIVCENSVVLDCWSAGEQGGIVLNTDDVYIANSTIARTDVGLYLPGRGNSTLLVDDNSGAADFYTAILASLGYGFDVCHTAFSLPDLSRYKMVIWFTGSGENGTLDEIEAGIISDYLNSSGSIILTGQGIGSNAVNTYLFTAQLNACYAGHASGREIAGNGFLANYSARINARYALNQGYILCPEQQAVLKYGDNRTAAMVRTGSWNAFYAEFSIDCLDTGKAEALLAAIFNHFGVFSPGVPSTIYSEDFEQFNGSNWVIGDASGNGTWGVSDYMGSRSLWCAGNASRDAESIAYYEDFESIETQANDTDGDCGSDGFGASSVRSAEGNSSLWCAGTGEQWEDEGRVIAYLDFTNFTLKAWDANRGNGLDYWGPLDGRAWCAGAGDEFAIMNLRARSYDANMNSTMLLPFEIPDDYATLAFELNMDVATGDYLEVGYTIKSSFYALKNYTEDVNATERLFLPGIADGAYFRFVSDGVNQSVGAYIDNVEVRSYRYTRYASENFVNGLGLWSASDNNPDGGYDTWSVIKPGVVWCAGNGAQSGAYESMYRTIFSENFDYGLVNWRTYGANKWQLSQRNLSAPYAASCNNSMTTIMPPIAFLETQVNASNTKSQRFEFDVIFERHEIKSRFYIEGLVDGGWKQIYEETEPGQRWKHCVFAIAEPFTAIRFCVYGNATVWLDNLQVSAICQIENTAVEKYDAHMNATLSMPLNLTSWEHVQMLYRTYYNISYGDALLLEAFAGGAWVTLREYMGTTITGWISECVDVPANASIIQFRFVSNGREEARGAFLSDIVLRGIHSILDVEAKRIDHSMNSTYRFSVNLTDYNTAYLSLMLWLDICDNQEFSVSIENGSASEIVARYTAITRGSELGGKWISQRFDLTQFAGSEICVLLHYTARHFGALSEGVYIDAIKVAGTTKKFYPAGMNASATLAVSLDGLEHAYLEFDYFANMSQDAAFRVEAGEQIEGMERIFDGENTDGWETVRLAIATSTKFVNFVFTSGQGKGLGVYIDNLRIGGMRERQLGDLSIVNTEIIAGKYGVVCIERSIELENLSVSGETGLLLRNSTVSTTYLRFGDVTIDAKLENSKLRTYNANIDAVSIECDARSVVEANVSIAVEARAQRDGIAPSGTDAQNNTLTFVQRGDGYIAEPRYFVKDRRGITWYAPYTVGTANVTYKLWTPPGYTLPAIQRYRDLDSDGLGDMYENSTNVFWVDMKQTTSNSNKFKDNIASIYGTNWTFNSVNITYNAVCVSGTSHQILIQAPTTSIKTITVPIPYGKYRLLFRARANDTATDRIVVFKGQGILLNTSLSTRYMWYLTDTFYINETQNESDKSTQLSITGFSTPTNTFSPNYSVFDIGAYVRIMDNRSQPTDAYYTIPTSYMLRDCDDDALSDAAEYPGFTNATAFIEAEFLGSAMPVQNASNGSALFLCGNSGAFSGNGNSSEPINTTYIKFTHNQFNALIKFRAMGSGILNVSVKKQDGTFVNTSFDMKTDFCWYAWPTPLTRGDEIVFTAGTEAKVYIDRVAIFDMDALARTRVNEGEVIYVNNHGSFNITVPRCAPLAALSFNVTASPEIEKLNSSYPVESVAVANNSVFYIENDRSKCYVKAYTPAGKFVIAERNTGARNIRASERYVVWEEGYWPSLKVCIAEAREKAPVYEIAGSEPDIYGNTVVYLPATKVTYAIGIATLTEGGIIEWGVDPNDCSGNVEWLNELQAPRIYGTRIAVLASNSAGEARVVLIDFSPFVRSFSGKSFHVWCTDIHEPEMFKLDEGRIFWVSASTLYVLDLATGTTHEVCNFASNIQGMDVAGDYALVYLNDTNCIEIWAVETSSGNMLPLGTYNADALSIGISADVAVACAKSSMEISICRASVRIDAGNDGTYDWEKHGFFTNASTGNLMERPIILSNTTDSTCTVRVEGSAVLSNFSVNFTTFTDPFLADTDFDGLSDGVELDAFFATHVLHLEDALQFETDDCSQSRYLEFGVLLGASENSSTVLSQPFEIAESGRYRIYSKEIGIINGTGRAWTVNLTELDSGLMVNIVDCTGRRMQADFSINFISLPDGEIKGVLNGYAYLPSGRYNLVISLNASTAPLSVIFEGTVVVALQGSDPLVSDTDGNGLYDGYEFEHEASPVSDDADCDGLSDAEEITAGTSALLRDTDFDGLRDWVEAGAGYKVQPISYWERMLYHGTPFNYSRYMANASHTSPLIPDTDMDGLPDGFIDGWEYYKDETGKYSYRNWHNSGICDGIIQIWEFEDLNLDGVHENYTWPDEWGFNTDTFEFYHWIQNGCMHIPGETDATNPDTDSDFCLDGYEVLYATQEPYDQYWVPRKANGMIYLLNPLDSTDGKCDVDIFEVELQDETRASDGHQDPLPPPQYINYTINDTVPARGFVFNYYHMIEIKNITFRAASNSSRITVLIYSGEPDNSSLLNETTVMVGNTLTNVTLSYDGIYLRQGYVVFRRTAETDAEAFIAGKRCGAFGEGDLESEYIYYTQNTWHYLSINEFYNISIDSASIDETRMPVNANINAWAVLINNSAQKLISSLNLSIFSESAENAGFICEVRAYCENVSPFESPVLWSKQCVLNGNGIYHIDIRDTNNPLFYVVLRYSGEPFFLLCNLSAKLRECWLTTSQGNEAILYFTPSITLSTYAGYDGGNARHGDGLNNSVEGAAYTNPLSDNTDRFVSGSIVYDDGLNDSAEMGMVVFRTNAENGTLTSENYRPGTWIEFRANRTNGAKCVRYDYVGNISSVQINCGNATHTAKENFKMYVLGDGSAFYRSADGNFVFLWTKVLPADFTNFDATCHIFAINSSATPTLATNYLPDPAYRDREIYLSSPFDIDSDDDGLRDGTEICWDLDVERENAYGISDLLGSAWDVDSDNDGIDDALEIAGLADSDNDGARNMVDADSDGDGVPDGKELLWNMDTDGDGSANMLDTDSDNDGITDSVEMHPYLWVNQMVTHTYTVYAGNTGIDLDKIISVKFDGRGYIYIMYKQSGSYTIGRARHEKYADRIVLENIATKSDICDFSVNRTGSVFVAQATCITVLERKQDGTWKEEVVVKGMSGGARALALNLTTLFFVTSGKIYAVNISKRDVSLATLTPVDVNASDVYAIWAGEDGIITARNSGIFFWNGVQILTEYGAKQGVAHLRDGSVLWCSGQKVYIAQPEFSKFYAKLNTYAPLALEDGAKAICVDEKDNLYVLYTDKFVMVKYTKTDPTRVDTDGDGLLDGYGKNGHSGEMDGGKCTAVVERVSAPRYMGYLESNEISLAPYVHEAFAYTDPTEPDSDGDGLNDTTEINGWKISVRDCALVTTSFLEPWKPYVIPHSKPFYGFNSRGEPEIISGVETVYTVSVKSNPLFTDTDLDGLSDVQEYGFTNPLDIDSDNDGLLDSTELGENGVLDANETSPVVRDTDGDGLPDGWLEIATDNTRANAWGFSAIAPLWDGDRNLGEGVWNVELHNHGTYNWLWISGREIGEGVGKVEFANNRFTEKFVFVTDPLCTDTDRDRVDDATEYIYLLRNRNTPFWDTERQRGENPFDWLPHDGNGGGGDWQPKAISYDWAKPDLLKYDSDSDGLSDGAENWVQVEVDVDNVPKFYRNTVLDVDTEHNVHLETDPTNPDCDGDGILDGQEFEWKNNTDRYDEYWDDINAWDGDTNDNVAGAIQREDTTNVAVETNGTVRIVVSNEIHPWSTVYVNLYYERTTDAGRNTYTTNKSYTGVRTFLGNTIWVPKPAQMNSAVNATVKYYAKTTITAQTLKADYLEIYCVFRTNARYDASAGRLMYTQDTWVVVPLQQNQDLTTLTRGNFTFCSVEDDIPEHAYQPKVKYGDEAVPVNAPDGGRVWLYWDGSAYTLYIRYSDTGKVLKFTYSGKTEDAGTAHSKIDFWRAHQETLDYRACANLDSDFDGLSNRIEQEIGTDPNDADYDDDGLSDGDEVLKYGTDPKVKDTDGDSLWDGLELGLVGDADPTTKTNPLDKDTDDDGIYDGAEDTNHNGAWDCGTETKPDDADTDDDGLLDSMECSSGQGGTGTSPVDSDSDDDGLPDGLELGLTYGMLTTDTDISRGNFTADCDEGRTKTLPNDSDSDKDGLSDGNEDRNHNGVVDESETDPNKADTDGDGLWDGYDKDGHYGERSVHENFGPTDPLCNDTDGDGLSDGVELRIANYPGIPTNRPATNPKSNDTDNDNLTDYQELHGWDYTVIWQKTKVKKGTYHTWSDPTVADTDRDGLSDYDEFLNHSDPWLSDTDGDSIPDARENTTEQWQIEGRDPWINGSISANVVMTITGYNGIIPIVNIVLTVSFRAEDNAGLDYITVSPATLSSVTVHCNAQRTYDFSHSWDVPLLSWNTWVSGYDVHITLADINGNGCNATAHADGAVEGVVKLILTAILSFVEEVKSIASEAINWLWEQINQLINQALEPIYNGIEMFVKGNYRDIAKLFMSKGAAKLAYGTDPKEMAKSYIQSYIGNIYLRILEIIYTVSNVIASIASAFATLVSTLVDTVIRMCKDMIVNAICKMLPAGFEWVKDIVDIALKGDYDKIPGMIIQHIKTEIMKMIGIVKEYVRMGMEKARTAIADAEAYINGILDVIVALLADPNSSLFALLNGKEGLGALENIPFLAQGKAFASSVGGIVNSIYGMKRDWKSLIMEYSGIIMAIVLDFVKRYLPGLPPNPSEMQVREKMKEVITQISKIVGENLTMLLDSGINYIYSTIERALSGIEFYKKEVVMQKVREFLKEKVRNALVEGLNNSLQKYASPAIFGSSNDNRPQNILLDVVSEIEKELGKLLQDTATGLVSELKKMLVENISAVLSEAENAVNQQMQQIQNIINQVNTKIEEAREIIKQALAVIQNPIDKGPELLFTLLKPWIPPIFLKILVIINDLYSVFSSAVSLFKYIKNMGTANIILKGIGLGTTSASLVMTIYQTYNDISEVMKEARI
jgi:hypothetical protein